MIDTKYMQERWGKNWDSRPHSSLCDCDDCGQWCEDWEHYEALWSLRDDLKKILEISKNFPVLRPISALVEIQEQATKSLKLAEKVINRIEREEKVNDKAST